MQKSRSIYVDMDDVLCETARQFLLVIEREFGKQVAYERLTDFDFETSCDLTPEERAKLYQTVHHADEILCIEPIPEAINVLSRMSPSLTTMWQSTQPLGNWSRAVMPGIWRGAV